MLKKQQELSSHKKWRFSVIIENKKRFLPSLEGTKSIKEKDMKKRYAILGVSEKDAFASSYDEVGASSRMSRCSCLGYGNLTDSHEK